MDIQIYSTEPWRKHCNSGFSFSDSLLSTALSDALQQKKRMYSQWKMKVNRLPFIKMHWCLTHCYRVFGNPQLIYMGMVWVWVESPSNTPQAQGSPPASNPNTSWPLVGDKFGIDDVYPTPFFWLLLHLSTVRLHWVPQAKKRGWLENSVEFNVFLLHQFRGEYSMDSKWIWHHVRMKFPLQGSTQCKWMISVASLFFERNTKEFKVPFVKTDAACAHVIWPLQSLIDSTNLEKKNPLCYQMNHTTTMQSRFPV